MRMVVLVCSFLASVLAAVLAMLLCSCRLSSSHSSSSVSATAATPMDLQSFECTDPGAFRIAEDDGVPCLELYRDADYAPPHRSPKAMAIVKGASADDFVLEVEAKQTGREYPHRDLVFVFGWRDPAHFCYAHLASQAASVGSRSASSSSGRQSAANSSISPSLASTLASTSNLTRVLRAPVPNVRRASSEA